MRGFGGHQHPCMWKKGSGFRCRMTGQLCVSGRCLGRVARA
ncbi:hypothetical protein SFR_5056 [Streptomyces sp. FR-008]|nr:hypothetical protein SFR_5056 [Streptomyces sp. FR-008]